MIHVAGPWIRPGGGLIIQRCMLCGHALTRVIESEDHCIFNSGTVVEVLDNKVVCFIGNVNNGVILSELPTLCIGDLIQ